MPARWKILLILAFWLGSTSWVLWAKVLRWQVTDQPPSVAFDITDEVRSQPTQWQVWRIGGNDQPDTKLGTMTTELRHERSDDTFLMLTKFPELKMTFASIPMKASKVDLQMRVTREGRLLSQFASATCSTDLASGISGTATLSASVETGQLRGNCRIESNLGNFTKELPPVPVPAGQILNPMMPVNRLVGVRPGKRWVIQYHNPLRDSISLLVQVAPKPQDLLASVRSESFDYRRVNGETTPCWVIDYESQDKTIRAETWVERDGGRVFRQQAGADDVTLRFDRQD